MLRALLVLATLTVAGCTNFEQGWFPTHEHNNYCGHGYLQDVHLNPTPGDFAGADAWRGPFWENEIRWRDPWRGNRPVPERPMPWDVPGGNASERGVPSWPRQDPVEEGLR